MRSFTANIIYRILCDGVATEQYEEQWRIVFAGDERAALAEARELGAQEECSFTDRHGRLITWQLIAVKEVQEVSIGHGALILSTVKEATPIADPVWHKSIELRHP